MVSVAWDSARGLRRLKLLHLLKDEERLIATCQSRVVAAADEFE